jgi:hypothetical protein
VDLSLPLAVGIVAFGIVVGLLSALFGIGGGLVMVPFIVLVLGEDQHLAEGTSLLVIVPTAIAGVIAHARRGYVDFGAAALLAAGGVFGAFAGALVALSTQQDALQTAFTIFLIVMGARMIRDGYRSRDVS